MSDACAPQLASEPLSIETAFNDVVQHFTTKLKRASPNSVLCIPKSASWHCATPTVKTSCKRSKSLSCIAACASLAMSSERRKNGTDTMALVNSVMPSRNACDVTCWPRGGFKALQMLMRASNFLSAWSGTDLNTPVGQR